MTVKIPIMVRLPRGLHARIKRAAGQNKNSLNNEMTMRLAGSFVQPDVARVIIKKMRGIFG